MTSIPTSSYRLLLFSLSPFLPCSSSHLRTRNANCKTTRGYNYIDFGEGYHTWRIGEQSPDGYFTIAHLGTKRSVVLMAPDVIEGSVPQNGLRAWFKNENADANNWKSTVNGYVTCERETQRDRWTLNNRQCLAPTSGE